MSQRDPRFAHPRTDHNNIGVSGSIREIPIAHQLDLEIKHLKIAATKRLNSLSASSLGLSCFINDQEFHRATRLKIPLG
jgi:hypothetical protein